MARILVVEDEVAIADLILLHLRHGGHEVKHAADGAAAKFWMSQWTPDLIILDWMLPKESGIELLRHWRSDARWTQTPVMMLTARSSLEDQVHGLDAGADDFLLKPFSPAALMARVRAQLRRLAALASRGEQSGQGVVLAGVWRLDPHTQTLAGRSQTVHLSRTEFRLMDLFLRAPGRLYSRDQLLDFVWGSEMDIEPRTVDVYVKRLRVSLSPLGDLNWLETVRGLGYRLNPSALQAEPSHPPHP